MKITLYMAITLNGYIARSNYETDWVCDTDWQKLSEHLNSSDVVIMGKKTMETSGKDFPYGNENLLNVVLSNNKKLHTENDQILITSKQPNELVEYLEELDRKSVIIIGGGILNASFLEAEIIDEVIFSIHPLILGEGIKVFERVDAKLDLELISADKLEEDLVQLKYKVLK